MKRTAYVVFGLILFGFASIAAHAGTACTVSTSGVAFGSYDPISNATQDSNGTVTVTCTGDIGSPVSYTVSASAGTGSFATRQMASGINSLNYNLYTDSARTQVWGDGTGSTGVISDSYTFTTSPTVRTYAAYGRIPAPQNQVLSGSYADNVTATVKW